MSSDKKDIKKEANNRIPPKTDIKAKSLNEYEINEDKLNELLDEIVEEVKEDTQIPEPIVSNTETNIIRRESPVKTRRRNKRESTKQPFLKKDELISSAIILGILLCISLFFYYFVYKNNMVQMEYAFLYFSDLISYIFDKFVSFLEFIISKFTV